MDILFEKNNHFQILGRTSEGGALPSVVQHVEVPILSLNQCRNMKYRSSRITPNMVCAGKGKQDSCQVRRLIDIFSQNNSIKIAQYLQIVLFIGRFRWATCCL